jgi:predicted PurR-regulated permease PerM
VWIFVSLIFWGWILGPVGMLLAVPLTMTLRIVFESHPGTRWVADILRPEAEQAPEEVLEEVAEEVPEEVSIKVRE